MQVMVAQCAGLDVHKKSVTACRRRLASKGSLQQEVKTFGTTTPELLGLADWLGEWEATHVAMESTGDYWKPVFNLLEGNFEVLLANAQHVKRVPGRKTDVSDAQWLAELLSYGLLAPSFIPPKPQRALRDLTRYRTNLVQERARVVNRVQKLLESANIKLASVASDVMGVSGRAMLAALLEGQMAPAAMAELARGQMRHKIPQLEKALTGVVEDHHRFLLAGQLAHIDFLDEQIARISEEISQRLEAMPPQQPQTPPSSGETSQLTAGDGSALAWDEAVALLDTIPGVNKHTAEVMLAEMGLDMAQFPSANHLAAWAGLAPGNHQSGGKRSSGRSRVGNRALKTVMVQAAHGAARQKNSYLSALYRRLAGRRGKKRALVAVAHSMLVSAYHMLLRRQPYHDLGPAYFDSRQKEAKTNRLLRQLERLGYAVQVEPLTSLPMPT